MRYWVGALFLFYLTEVKAAELWVADKARYEVRVAQSEDELVKGLMFVKKLAFDEGMLFDLRAYKGKKVTMWMKNTYIPLDMLFIDCGFRVVDIFHNAVPLSLERIGSREDFCYVLEINGGECKKQKIAIGDEVLVKF